MDNKTRRVVVIGILLFVGVLFVGGFGDSITGNAVVGSQVVELGLEDEVQVLGREISIINVKDATRMSTFGSPRESEVVLKVSGFAGTINMRKASDINGLKIKLLSAEYPKTPDVRIKILVSKAMGARPNAGIGLIRSLKTTSMILVLL